MADLSMFNPPKRTLNDIVDFVVNKAYQIVEWKILEATAQYDLLPKDYWEFNKEKLQEILEMVKPLLTSAQQTRKIEAETSKDIVKLVAKGKISLDESIKLMTLAKLQLEIKDKEMDSKFKKTMLNILGEGDI